MLHTKEVREAAIAEGREPPAISATRNSLLQVPLSAYQQFAPKVEAGYIAAAKFLHSLKIFKARDLPYQTQLVPLAAILAELGNTWENDAVLQKLAQWYWCGVLGELYGSAAYKGVHALLMKCGAEDFKSGQPYDQAVFFDENVDIHHIFPQAWCKSVGIGPEIYNSIVNKTPIASGTNRMLGGVAPSSYLGRLTKGNDSNPPIAPDRLTAILESHEIEESYLLADDFDGFMDDRRRRLLALIENAMGKEALREAEVPSDHEEEDYYAEEEQEAAE
ncbi:MAG: hypothetical protein AAF494_06675 [Pseudomonadota bacterium]